MLTFKQLYTLILNDDDLNSFLYSIINQKTLMMINSTIQDILSKQISIGEIYPDNKIKFDAQQNQNDSTTVEINPDNLLTKLLTLFPETNVTRLIYIDTLINELIKQWENETQFVSSVSIMSNTPTAKLLTLLGKEVIPYIVKYIEEQKYGTHLYIIIFNITNEAPNIPKNKRGNIKYINKTYVKMYKNT